MGKYAKFVNGKLVPMGVSDSQAVKGLSEQNPNPNYGNTPTETTPYGIKTFDDALFWYGNLKSMRQDLPDGQWQELKEQVSDYVSSYGKDTKKWPEDAKEGFKQTIIENLMEWS